MTIDILSYELKYKNDRHILDLLEAYKHEKDLEWESLEQHNTISDRVAELEKEVEELEDNISEWREDVRVSIDNLSDLEELDKEDIIDYVKKTLNVLDGLENDMNI